jgi:hypothetical protein
MQAFVPILIVIAYLGVIIFVISLLMRLVRAIEKIAAKIENSPKI